MTTDPWRLFPYPTWSEGRFVDGAVMDVHEDCLSCTVRECLGDTKAPPGEPRQCRFGLTYAKVDAERVLLGVVGSDLAQPTARARRRYKEERERHATSGAIRMAVQKAVALGPGVTRDLANARQAVLAELGRDPELAKALAEQLRKEFNQTLNQSHDFLQLVKLVRGHAEALLREKYPKLSPEDAAEAAPIEGAIFFSTELMLVKMDSLIFLQEVNRAFGAQNRFRIHPLVLKYVRIYAWQADQKNLHLRLEGNCYGESLYNTQAIGAVVQGLLDNLVKYAPPGSRATVDFQETEDEVSVSFNSLGPRIDPDEETRIFLPGYRGKAARLTDSSGLGVGLATAKQISDALDLQLRVHQESTADTKYADRFPTRFEIVLQRSQ